MNKKSNMYQGAKTWNPFQGCQFGCLYCQFSFQRQAKRLRKICNTCAEYEPHFHPERLKKIPRSKIVFVCGNADISFAPDDVVRSIIRSVKDHGKPDQVFYFQSKKPECFEPYLESLPSNAILLTTLETNRDEGYQAISKAPLPSIRFEQFKNLEYPRKVLTLEPLLKFDHDILVEMVKEIIPEYVWMGVNSKRQFKALQALPEPTVEEFYKLYQSLSGFVAVKTKTEPERSRPADVL